MDTAPGDYELLALSFDGRKPRFTDGAKRMAIDDPRLTVYYDAQCPFILQKVESIRAYCDAHQVPANLIEVDSLEKAKALPCVFNNWAIFWQGQFQTVNLEDAYYVEKLLTKANGGGRHGTD